MLQSTYMSYTTNLLYDDEPAGSFFKIMFAIVLLALLSADLYVWSIGRSSGGAVLLLVEAIVIASIFWFVLPRRYQVYEDHLRIELGGPFEVKIGFDQIAAIKITNKVGFTIHFTTTVTKTYVKIVKKKGLSIMITPKSNALFIESANRALREWQEKT